jgi:hypothetical protein
MSKSVTISCPTPKGLAQFVHDFDSGNSLEEVLSNAVIDGLDKLQTMLMTYSSNAIFKNLEDTVSFFAEKTEVVTVELILPRTVEIKLRLTAKEYSKSPTELLSLCLAQSFTVSV